MSTNIIVYIKVKEAIDNQMAYIIPDYPWILIPKSTCTVIETVEHVEELERQIKYLQAPLNTYEIEESVTMKHVQPEPKLISKVVPKEGEIWKYYNDHFIIGIIKGESCQVKGLDGNKWNCEYPIKYFISNDNWTHCSEPEPQRKSLGMYDGVEIYEDTKAWFVDLKTLEINAPEGFELENWVEDNINNESKVYLTPKEANARLKEIVREKAKDYPVSITVTQWFSNNKQFIHYAIEAFEKDHNITYLPE